VVGLHERLPYGRLSDMLSIIMHPRNTYRAASQCLHDSTPSAEATMRIWNKAVNTKNALLSEVLTHQRETVSVCVTYMCMEVGELSGLTLLNLGSGSSFPKSLFP
jgi:hypothetical protein